MQGLVEIRRLQPHPATRPGAIHAVEISVHRDVSSLTLSYAVQGDMARLHLPPHVGLRRADQLWQTTCLELFITRAGAGYQEFNLSPSGQWAAYVFDGYRSAMAPIPGAPILANDSRVDSGSMGLVGKIDLDTIGLSGRLPLRLGASAVIEETDGTKSYWALAHPSDKPDFHHPDSFVLELP